MLQKKYHIDREFRIILQLSGKMDEQMALIDHLLCDDMSVHQKILAPVFFGIVTAQPEEFLDKLIVSLKREINLVNKKKVSIRQTD